MQLRQFSRVRRTRKIPAGVLTHGIIPYVILSLILLLVLHGQRAFLQKLYLFFTKNTCLFPFLIICTDCCYYR